MNVIRVGNKFKVAINGKFVATYDTLEEAEKHCEKPVIEDLVEPLPQELNLGSPYELE